jgi:hypothetical protein
LLGVGMNKWACESRRGWVMLEHPKNLDGV